ncbi:MAG: NIPSNAP family protein [Alphaproteobacteria bacterium]|nr:NIPSNAP family protein [Alphaproteobacteria bacterium]
MILEHRAYTMQPGLHERFYELQVERGFDAIKPVLDRLVGYFSTVSGPLEQVVHLYAFASLEDWRDRLHGLYDVPELLPYFEKVRPIMLAQENHVLLPAPVDALAPYFKPDTYWQRTDGPIPGAADMRDLILEEQIISLRPGQLPKYWSAIEKCGLNALSPLDKNRLGSFFMMVGPLHQVYHYWFFDGFDDRTRRLNAVHMNPEWAAFQEEVRPIVARQETKLMRPAPVAEMVPVFREG